MFLESRKRRFGPLLAPVKKIHEDLFTDWSKERNVLDKYIEVLKSFGRAGCPVKCGTLEAKFVALVREGTHWWSCIGGFPKPLYFVPRRDLDGLGGREWGRDGVGVFR